MREYQICSRCVMDTEGEPSISFDENGVCNYCTQAAERLAALNAPKDFSRVEACFEAIKEDCKDAPYDCLVGVSGGLDSSYCIYLGHKFGLRMLGVHIDDGLDTALASENIRKLCEAAHVDLKNIQLDMEQYRDLILSFFKAGVPNLAIPQDNLIQAALIDLVRKHKLKYLLFGGNISMEGVLQTGNSYTAADDVHIRAIQKRFSGKPIDHLRLTSTLESSVFKRLRKDVVHVRPLNMIDYRMDTALQDLYEFCGYEYYDGKHHESVLPRFMQCWYLPEKFGVDKRKSHLSSMIVSGQMKREDALAELAQKGYPSEELKESDFNKLAEFFGISREEFDRLLAQPAHSHDEYPKSFLSARLIPFLLRYRKLLHF